MTPLVRKPAPQNQELFAESVLMSGKPAAGREADDARRSRHLVAVPIQQSTLDSRHGRRKPLRFVGETHGPFTEIGVDQHLQLRMDLSPSYTLFGSAPYRNPFGRK
jgi:hypothetical protein